MVSANKTLSITTLALVILVVVAFFAITLAPTSLSILGNTNTHYHTIDGVRVGVLADWQETVIGNDNDCVISVADISGTQEVGATYTTTGTDVQDTCPAKVFETSFAFPDIDLRDVERLTIQRDINYNVIVENRNLVLESTVMQTTASLSAPTTGIGGVSGEYNSPIIITQANDVITIDSSEGRQIIDASGTDPILFSMSFRMGGSTGDPNDVDGHVFITDIDVEYIGGGDVPPAQLSIWQQVQVWFSQVFDTLKGWFRL